MSWDLWGLYRNNIYLIQKVILYRSDVISQMVTTCNTKTSVTLWDALCNLVPFVQFKKREKHPWSITFSKITLIKLTLLHGCFFTFFKSYKWHQTVQSITYDMTKYPRRLTSDISVVEYFYLTLLKNLPSEFRFSANVNETLWVRFLKLAMAYSFQAVWRGEWLTLKTDLNHRTNNYFKAITKKQYHSSLTLFYYILVKRKAQHPFSGTLNILLRP